MSSAQKQWEAWLATRPPCVQALARRFPAGEQVVIGDHGRSWIIGYTESDELILSAVDPFQNFDAAREARFYVHASCVRPFDECTDRSDERVH